MIAGLGSIGRRHLQNLVALGEKDILLFRTHKSTLPDDELAEFPVETDLMRALDHRPDAVIVSNPTANHLDVAIPAAQAGCHLLLEKPVSNSMQGIDQLYDALAHGGGRVMVGYQFRFHPGLRMVEGLLKDGAVGRLVFVRAHWGEYLPGWHPWEDYREGYSARADLGGGVLLTLSHPFDYLLWLVGDVFEVWSLGGTLGDLDVSVEDLAEIGLRFSSGIIANVHLDYLQQPPQHTLELIGTQGTIYWDFASGGVRMYQEGAESWQTLSIQDGFHRNDMFLAEMQHFIEVVHGKEQPVCSLADGVSVMEVALGARLSIEEKRFIRLGILAEKDK